MARRNYLINKPFQLKFISFCFWVAAVVVVVFLMANLQFFSKFYSMGEALNLPADHVFYQFLAEQKKTLMKLFILSSVIGTAFIFIYGMFFSHKIAGPLYRLHTHMMKVARGETDSDVSFRKGDFFPELADAYNAQLKRKKSA